jgi:circadian clock protein KaiC
MTQPPPLLASDVPGLDKVLGGGLGRNELVLIVGAPGAGKTVLASQILFGAVRQGMRGLVFTTFSEGNTPYLEHMRPFAFFDEGMLGDAVALYSLESQRPADDTSIATTLVRTIREARAQIVLLDGFQGFGPLIGDPAAARSALAALATQIRYLQVTLLITLAGDIRDPHLATELTVADAAIGLHYSLQGRRHTRLLDVAKRRGRAQLPGTHAYQITTDGIAVYPRLEATASQAEVAPSLARAPFRLAELDTLVGGGLTHGTTTLFAGAPGTGKTTLALHWAVADCRPDARTVYLAFSERPAQLVQKAAAFGLDLAAKLAEHSVDIVWLSPVELDPDVVAQRLRQALEGEPVARLVIDDITVLIRALGARSADYLAALHLLLASAGITSLFLLEIPPFQGFQVSLDDVPIGVLSENVIVIQHYETRGMLRRLLAVLRMRFSKYDRTIRELIFEDGAVRVLRPEESTPGVLQAAAEGLAGVAPDDARES